MDSWRVDSNGRVPCCRRAWGAGATLALLLWLGPGCGESAEAPEDLPDAGHEGTGPENAATQWSDFSERPCPPTSILTYENFGAGFMSNWCNGCHSADRGEGQRQAAPLGIDFDALEDVRAHAERIWARSGDHNRSMPPAGAAPDAQRAQLGEWLACGAPSRHD